MDKMLPIGTVVRLKGANRRLMVIGYCAQIPDNDRAWDYIACMYPSGYIAADQSYLFNAEDVDQVVGMGHQDDEQILFMEQAGAAYEQWRKEHRAE